MALMETVLKRRSTRKYTGEHIPEEKINAILQAGLLAPTSRSLKPCEFYVIKERATLEKLSKSKAHGAAMLADCDTAIAVFADSEKADTWIEDSSIALSFMMLAATEQGIGNCWVQMHMRSSADGKNAEENVKEILDITDAKMRNVGILALGISAQELKPYSFSDAEWNKVHGK